MALQVPVLACASGGPAETIVHRRTGFLLGPDVAEWKEAMLKLAGDRELAREMGKAGYERVADKFSLKEMGKGMTALLIQVCRLTKRE